MPILGPSDAFSPREWGAAVNYDSWRDLYVPKDAVALHHGGGSDYTAAQPPYSTTKEATLLRSWEGFHLRKGWRGLAYGWAVGQSGAIYRIRGWGIYGAHRGDVDGDGVSNNREIVPIIWVASGNHHTMTPEADASIRRLRAFVEHHAPQATRLWGHREIQAEFTECPGPNGMVYVKSNRTLPEEEPVRIPQPSWLPDDVIDRLIKIDVLKSKPAEEPAEIWRTYVFLDRLNQHAAREMSKIPRWTKAQIAAIAAAAAATGWAADDVIAEIIKRLGG